VRLLLAGLAGLLFGAGLVVAGMTNPANILSFLDISGAWDPTLMFVMGGAVITYAILIRPTLGRGRPLLDSELHLPVRSEIDLRLVAGAAIFGVGWGLSGFCPGPAIVAAVTGLTSALVFVAAMVAGMLVWHQVDRR
jgi:uncharacterized membrane protein YedE/YeeE